MSRANPDYERLIIPCEFKLLSPESAEDGGMIEGYAATFDTRHESGDRVMRGAFKKTIQERVKKGMVPLLDSHQWDIAHTLGTVTDAAEDSKGLHFTAKFSKAPSVQDARQKMAEGHINRLSIGFLPVRENSEAYDLDTGDPIPANEHRGSARRIGIGRQLHELKLFEISGVPLADDPNATIREVHTIVPFQDLPLAPRDRPWDAAAAVARVREWAGGEKINWARYRRAFVWYDKDKADEYGSYKLPIADVIDGELMAVPRGIFAAAGVLEGARGGADLNDPDSGGDEKAGARRHLERYYAKMAHQWHDDSIVAPWNKKSLDLIVAHAAIGVYDFDEVRNAACEFFSALKPEDRGRLLAELSAGPVIPPTDDGERELAALKARSVRLENAITRWRDNQ
jgi:HK97 family phage prohead protease